MTQPLITIIGANGMLGTAWRKLLDARGLGYAAVDYPAIDITSAASIAQHLTGPGAVVNCAAYTDVDGAEANLDPAMAVNATAVGLLAARCKEVGSTLVHYSTDYVFNGRATAPYPVDAPHDPVNAYGRSKAAGEQALFDSGAKFLLLRTSWLYAPWGKNFVLTMLNLTKTKPKLLVVDDQRGRPTSAEHLAATSLALLDKDATGTLHVTDGGECTWHGFTVEIARLAGHTACEVAPCSSDQYPRPAVRPAYSVLDLGPTEQIVGPMPRWQDNLAKVVAAARGA